MRYPYCHITLFILLYGEELLWGIDPRHAQVYVTFLMHVNVAVFSGSSAENGFLRCRSKVQCFEAVFQSAENGSDCFDSQ